MTNERHGSYRRELLRQLKSLRADLRFREDGIHTTLTLDREARAPPTRQAPVTSSSARRP